MYLIRLDDACEYMDLFRWERVLSILKAYSVCPLIGIIPQCKDENFVSKYPHNPHFWQEARKWQEEGFILAMHGLHHVYHQVSGGLNPVHERSEYVGLSYKEQAEKIRTAQAIFTQQNIQPTVFFAPSHTFDSCTLEALKEETSIRIISDTIAADVYKDGDFFFLPCHMGRTRWLPFRFVGIALHPNEMTENDFDCLEAFLKKYNKQCVKSFADIVLVQRSFSFFDRLLKSLYFFMRKLKKFLKRVK